MHRRSRRASSGNVYTRNVRLTSVIACAIRMCRYGYPGRGSALVGMPPKDETGVFVGVGVKLVNNGATVGWGDWKKEVGEGVNIGGPVEGWNGVNGRHCRRLKWWFLVACHNTDGANDAISVFDLSGSHFTGDSDRPGLDLRPQSQKNGNGFYVSCMSGGGRQDPCCGRRGPGRPLAVRPSSFAAPLLVQTGWMGRARSVSDTDATRRLGSVTLSTVHAGRSSERVVSELECSSPGETSPARCLYWLE
ncbi:hypothetical protein L2E82_02035 [Cichorium intybus]|uniref:Uncharacterized protein n=1 Tax=Cichorium intybus TaxID=13427 RepID=A0ACB9H1L6_CICIN|nr:hypothetical protein L2E82_02035 [Cichorium intybus]